VIQNILPIIGSALNEYLKNTFGETEDRVAVMPPGQSSGAANAEGDNKILLSLINLEEEKGIRNTGIGQAPGTIPAVHISLYVLFAANFPEGNYREGLRFLSAVIYFFQGNRVFDPQNTPLLPPEVEKITPEIINLDFQVLSNIWNMLGGKYLPSIVYRFRLLPFQQHTIQQEILPLLFSEKRRKKKRNLGEEKDNVEQLLEKLKEGNKTGSGNIPETPGSIDFSGSDIAEFPEGLTIAEDLILDHCANLQTLPRGLKVGGSLYIRDTPLAALDDAELLAMIGEEGYIIDGIVR